MAAMSVWSLNNCLFDCLFVLFCLFVSCSVVNDQGDFVLHPSNSDRSNNIFDVDEVCLVWFIRSPPTNHTPFVFVF